VSGTLTTARVGHSLALERDDNPSEGTETPFPERVAEERAYPRSPAYRTLYLDVLDYCRESIASATDLQRRHQRVRHWAAIALLRCVLSSPEAAIAMLSERAKRQGIEEIAVFDTDDEMDATYRPQVLDPLEEGDSGDGQSGLYNALYQSRLHVKTASVVNRTAIVHLVGTKRLGGVCDDPRVAAQLRHTAGQFPTVRRTATFINNVPLWKRLSEK
jgi:hypothetical protein